MLSILLNMKRFMKPLIKNPQNLDNPHYSPSAATAKIVKTYSLAYRIQ
jgi:hypothetical protein